MVDLFVANCTRLFVLDDTIIWIRSIFMLLELFESRRGNCSIDFNVTNTLAVRKKSFVTIMSTVPELQLTTNTDVLVLNV